MIPVREALRLLEAEGFVDILPNRGARVASLSLEDMHDVYRTRIVLEIEALRQSVPLISSQMLGKGAKNEREAGSPGGKQGSCAVRGPSGISLHAVRTIGVALADAVDYECLGSHRTLPPACFAAGDLGATVDEHERILL